jgi:hypothetical protein
VTSKDGGPYVCPTHLAAFAAGYLRQFNYDTVRISLERVREHDPTFADYSCTVCGKGGLIFRLRPGEVPA